MRALIVIDYTVDFVTGKLPCGPSAVAIEPHIAALTRSFIEQGDLVVMAVDLHEVNDPYHPEAKLFPPHNIRGTTGRELYGMLQTVYEEHHSAIKWIDKTRYSAFCGTELELLLAERQIRELHLIGVCTDICVLHTAVDAYNKGYKLTVYEQAVASFQEQANEWALNHFRQSLGATVLPIY